MESSSENNQTPVVPAPETAPAAEQVAAPTEPSRAPTHKNLLISILAGVIILGAAGYYVYSSQYANGGVVSVVNGEKIYRDAFDKNVATMQEAAVQQGVDITDPAVQAEIQKQSLQMLIDNVLLTTAATDAGMSASDEEVAEKYDSLVLDVGGEAALTTQLAAIDLSRDELMDNIRERVLVDKYIESVTDIENITVTEEEVVAFVESLNIPDLPPLEEIRPQVESQIHTQKQQAMLAEIIEGLRSKASIENKI